MALSDNQAKNAKAGPAPYFIPDGAGLRLRIALTGARSCQFPYRAGGKENILSFGAYPAVTLAQARVKASLTRAAVAGGGGPVQAGRRADVADLRGNRPPMARNKRRPLETALRGRRSGQSRRRGVPEDRR